MGGQRAHRQREICVILVRPKNSGNVGAIARIMKNFGAARLYLIDPRCNPRSKTAKRRAMHANDILDRSRTIPLRGLRRFDLVVGTTARLGSRLNVLRLPTTPKTLARRIKAYTGRVGILFGPEGDGLRNEELGLCDASVTIPASIEYPTLNLSHSVAIVLYELFGVTSGPRSSDIAEPLLAPEKRHLIRRIQKLLNQMAFRTPGEKLTQEKVWRRLIGKGFLYKREAYALFGFLSKVQAVPQKRGVERGRQG